MTSGQAFDLLLTIVGAFIGAGAVVGLALLRFASDWGELKQSVTDHGKRIGRLEAWKDGLATASRLASSGGKDTTPPV